MAESAQRVRPVRHAARAWGIDLLLIAGAVLFLYAPLAFTHQSLPTDEFWSDLISLAQPTFEYSGKTLVSGALPLWNPYWFSGYPHLAMPSAAVFYPMTILYGLLSFGLASKIIALVHAYLAGAFSYILGREVIGGRIAALYFALTAIVGDLVIVWFRNGQLWSLQTLTWFPLGLVFIHRICSHGRWGSAAGLAVTIALMVFGGDPQALGFCLWFLGPYTAVLLLGNVWKSPAAWRQVLAQAVICLGALGLGMALAAIQLLPSRELFAESIRGHGLTYQYLSISGFPRLMRVYAWLEDTGFNNIAITASCRIVIALAVVGLLFSRKLAVGATLIASLVCLLYILLPEWLYVVLIQHLPVYSGVRGAFRMCIILWWAITFLSAFGVAAWLSKDAPAQRRPMAAVALAVLAIFVVWPIVQRSEIAPIQAVAWAVAGIGAVVALLHKPASHRWMIGSTVLLIAAALELGWFAKSSNVASDPAALSIDPDYVQYSSSRTSMDRIALLPHYGFRHGTSVGMMTGDRALMGYHGLLLTNYARLFRDAGDVPVAPMDAQGRLEVQDFTKSPQLARYITAETLPILNVLNVREFVEIGKPRTRSDFLVENPEQFTITQIGKLHIYSNPHALPPVFPIHEIIVCESDAEALALMRERKVDFSRQATITGDFNADSVGPVTRPEMLSITGYAPERISVTAELSAPAVLMFSEMYYPGWRATVDGVARDVLPVNTALRGVHVEAGRHDVVLTYEPDSLKQGMVVSAGALVVLAVLLVLAWRRSRRGSVTAPGSPA